MTGNLQTAAPAKNSMRVALLLIAGLGSGLPAASAQQGAITIPQPPAQSDPQASAQANGQSGWYPQGVASLGQNASSRTEFTLDRSMIVIASKMVDQDDSDLRRVVAGLNAISVHCYRFPGPGLYDPAAIQALRQQYHVAGWQHMVSDHNKGTGNGISDLWIHFHNAEINDIAVLISGPTQLNFFSVSGALRPLDLAHLSGHFGIPRFDGGTLVPAPDGR
jgi:hypothetical protein